MHARSLSAKQPDDEGCAEGSARGRVVFRCDGGERIGAGHVARCLPLAGAFSHLGLQTCFAGYYDGLARWLIERSGLPTIAVERWAPCGVNPRGNELAVVDSYTIATRSICELAEALPVLTLAEAARCPHLGILLDYHLDRLPTCEPRVLGGPRYAPLDPAFAAAGRPGADLNTVLVSVGGSSAAARLQGQIATAAALAFPDADVLLAGPQSRETTALSGAELETFSDSLGRIRCLPQPSSLVDVASGIDLAITAAGLTSYELACAGVPQLTIALADNQRRVIDGLHSQDLAVCLDLTRGDSLRDLPPALRRMREPMFRRELSERGMRVFDGRGAERAATAVRELLD